LYQISLPWQPRPVLLKFDWHHLIAYPGETPVRGKHLGDIFYTRRVKGDFVLNFVAMATGIGRGRICLTSFDSPPTNTPYTRGYSWHRDIFYTRGVVACFVSNFVAMATRVGRCKIWWLTSFDSPTTKTPCFTQRSLGYLLYKPSYSRFCPKFRCHGNGGWSW